MDYRRLLIKYMALVGSIEGVDYLGYALTDEQAEGLRSERPRFTQEELEALNVCSEEADDEV